MSRFPVPHLMVMTLLLLGFLTSTVPIVVAAEESPTSERAVTYPGIAELLPYVTRLETKKENALEAIAALKRVDALRLELSRLQSRQQDLARQFASWGGETEWGRSRLVDAEQRLRPQQNKLNTLLDEIAHRLNGLDAIQQEWRAESTFWQGWQESLAKTHLSAAEELFSRIEKALVAPGAESEKGTVTLLELQQQFLALSELVGQRLAHYEALLVRDEGAIFERNSPSFFDAEFSYALNDNVLAQMDQGIAQVQLPDESFFRRNAVQLIVQVLLVLTLWGSLRRLQYRPGKTDEWDFALQHPLASGFFVAVAGLGLFYEQQSPLWGLILWGLAAFSTAVLVTSLLRNRRKIVMVFLLAALFVLSLLLKLIAFPELLYRIYLALLCLGGMPFLFWLSRVNQRQRQGNVDGFSLALRGGVAILALALAAQLSGYSMFASRLIESTIEIVFMGLILTMALRLGRGGLDLLHEVGRLRSNRFFAETADDLIERLKQGYALVLGVVALLYLLQVAEVVTSFYDAWGWLTGLAVTLGDARLSVGMLLSAALILYAMFFLSWLLQAFLDHEIFHKHALDRGVRDAIKKLLHYGLILFGGMLALGAVGVDFQNLAVIAGAFGIGIGFGLQNIVNNFVSGIILLFERPVKVGDVVVLDGEWGTILKIGLRSTIVETLDQAEIIVPNSQLISEKVTNWTLSSEVTRLVLPVGVAYGSDMTLVLKILKEVAQNHPLVLKAPEPSQIFTGFGDSSLDFELRVWMREVKYRLQVKSELGQAIDARFRQEGVEIPFPQRDLHVRSIPEGWRQNGAEEVRSPAE
ncbi:MAG: hypothetical protein C0621_03470 [Desulfuromonas sp.]|nr:MAG: hypothetical protein C0621_03470 [Desulfuromonas sp.]